MAKKAAKKAAPAAKAKTEKSKSKAAPAKKEVKAKPAAKAATGKPAKPAKSAKPSPVVKAAGSLMKSAMDKVVKAAKSAVKDAEEKVTEMLADTETSEPPTKGILQTSGKTKAAKEPAAKKEKVVKEKKSEKIARALASEEQAKWTELREKYKALKPANYSIGGVFEARSPIQHKVFGWGYILSNEYDRLEVLFEDGKRMLISNRKL